MTGGLQDIGQAQCTMFPCEHIMQDQGVSVTIDTCLAATDRTPNTVTYCVLDDWLTVHSSITLVDLPLDAQNSYLFTYNIFIKILYMFRVLPCSSSGGLRRNCIYAASGIITLCR